MDYGVFFAAFAAGVVAGLADYGLGLGFGLAASMVLVGLLGFDPRLVAGSASASQLVTGVPAVLFHRREGNISVERLADAREVIVVLVASASIAALATPLVLAGVGEDAARLAYAVGLAPLSALLWLAPGGAGRAGGLAGGRRGRRLFVAGVVGAVAGADKAVVGGGFSVMLVVAQVATGVNVKTAIALAPLLKMLPFALVTLGYGLVGLLDPLLAAGLAAGGLASAPMAAKLLRRVGEKRVYRAAAVAVAAASARALAEAVG